MRQFYLYILLCSDQTYYVGITNDILRRVAEHNQGIASNSYTNKRRPVELMFYEVFYDPQEAIRREKQIKKWSHAKKEALINSDFNQLVALAKKPKGNC